MRVYVLGAGFSLHAGYPLANELLNEIHQFASQQYSSVSSWRTEWPKVRRWLTAWWWCPVRLHRGLKEAYKLGNVEAVISLLDAVGEIAKLTTAEDVGQYQEAKHRGENPSENFFKASTAFSSRTKRERAIRSCLEEALIEYFEWRDQQDNEQSRVDQWTLIHKFCGESLKSGDAIISFNYDCSLERVLLQQGRFAVKYVENLPNIPFLIPNKVEPAQNNKPEGEILLLKLHGSVGWQPFVYLPYTGIPAQHLERLGANPKVQYPDGKNGTLATNRTIIVPTWFKTFDQDHLFSQLWKQALEAMEKACEVVVIGYSFPKADVASWLLRQAGRRGWIWVDRPEGKEHALHYSFESWVKKSDTRSGGEFESNEAI